MIVKFILITKKNLDYTTRILIFSGERLGLNTYQETVHALMGKSGYFLLILAQFSYPFISKFWIYLTSS